jgi:outer membrane biosynthesis protein TonB
LTKVEFAAEAVQALDVVFGKETQEQPAESTQPQPSETVQPQPTETAQSTAKTTKPKAPVLKSVKAGKKTAKVTWGRVTGVKGYVVYRAASKKGTYKKVAAVSGAKKTSYQVKKLKSKKKYFFKVKSYTLNGKTKVYSGWSNSKSVKVK